MRESPESQAEKLGAIENIPQKEWHPALRDIVAACRQNLGADLSSIYVRGSVASGKAVERDDVDLEVLVHVPKEDVDRSWVDSLNTDIIAEYPFVEKVDVVFAEVDDDGVPKSGSVKLFIKLQGVCVDGLDIKDKIREFVPGRETRHYSLILPMMLNNARADMQKGKLSNEEVCKRVMNKMARAAYELVAGKEGKVCHEVEDCYAGFSKHYPEKEAEMRQVRDLYLNPTPSAEEIERVMDSFGTWLLGEIEKTFPG